MIEQKTPLAAAVFASLYPASQAMAQNVPPAGDPTRLESVTVTATRRSENLQDVAQSVTALSTEFIQKQALTNMYDLVGALPSVSMVSYVPGQNNIVMRGITTGNAQFRIDSQVSVYLDDQPMTAISQQPDVRLIDIERVEALPGPQGTLFGSSAQAGTLRYVTNKPDVGGFSSEVSAEIGTTKGGDASYDVSGWVNLPVSDNFALRVVGFWAEEGGYVDNVLGPTLMQDSTNADVAEDDQNIYRTTGGRLAGLWTINENWDLLGTAIFQRGDTMGTWETDPFLGDNKVTRFFDEWRDDTWYTTALTLHGDVGFADLSVTASYFNRKFDYEWDNTNYAQWRSAYYGPYYALYDTGTLKSQTFNFQKQNRWSYEARLTSKDDSKLQWMAGAFYEDVYDWWKYGAQHNEADLLQTPAWAQAQADCLALQATLPSQVCPLAPTPYYYINKYHNEVKQTAVFGELTYAFTDKWSATAGARWFEFDRDMFDLYQVPLGLPAQSDPDANGLTSKATESDTSLKFSTEYHFTPDVMAYALYSEGFRLGGQNSQRAADTGVVPLEYGPDYLSNYEVGLKSEWFDHRLQLNLSAFLMEWDDIQIHIGSTSSGTNGAFYIEGNINGGTAEQKGVEFNGSWLATDRLSFDWSIFLASPEFTEDTFRENDIPGVDDPWIAKGWTMPISPKEKYWVSAEYRFPEGLLGSGEWWTRFSYTWQGKVWDSLADIEDYHSDDPDVRAAALDFLIPEWKSGTFQVGYTSSQGGWDAAFIVRNVFDDASYSYLSGTNYGEFFGDPRFNQIRTLQRPISYSLSFTKRW
ncbi:MAG TPA: TonB-dependent receptor [Steroidobacteraceae bacterium]|nr:TonB-dependent receptor [Steroidobacteraceae bacterium]